MTVLVTGVAGFIGFHVVSRLLDRGDAVVGIDNLAPYYDVRLKQARLAELKRRHGFEHEQVDITDRAAVTTLFRRVAPEHVVHLAAQPGVRYSLENPQSYIDANLIGFGNILEAARAQPPAHLLYASSSSVYGANRVLPWSEHHGANHPISLYAATKKANEAMAHSYSHLFRLPMTGLRFFTVYGEWGRPDMVPFKFARAMRRGEPIDLYNEGRTSRNFTYVGDAAEAVIRLMPRIPQPVPQVSVEPAPLDPATSPAAPCRLVNIGSTERVEIGRCVALLEAALGLKARIRLVGRMPGDVDDTWADVTDLEAITGYRAKVDIEEGIARFAGWYAGYPD